MISNDMVNNYKEALLRHPIGLQSVLACTSISLGFGIHVEGVPIYVASYVQLVPAWIIALTFILSGVLSFAGLNPRLLGPTSNIVNNTVIMFLWVWLAIGTLVHPASTALAYMTISPPLACAWVLAHSLLPKE